MNKRLRTNIHEIALRNQIGTLLGSADRLLLDKVIATLNSHKHDEELTAVLSKSTKSEKIKNYISILFTASNAPLYEKKEFLGNFNKGMINEKELLSSKSSVNKWFTGNNFSKNIFLQICKIGRERGVGPGEYALEAFSSHITSTRASASAGDFEYENQYVEVKGKGSAWGRLHDNKRMDYNIPLIKDRFNKHGILYPTLTVNIWLKEVRPAKSKTTLYELAKVSVDNLFTKVSDTQRSKLIYLLAESNMHEIKKEWANLSFINYQNALKFTGILFFDTNSQKTWYVTDANSVSLYCTAPQLYGPSEQAMPKVWPVS